MAPSQEVVRAEGYGELDFITLNAFYCKYFQSF